MNKNDLRELLESNYDWADLPGLADYKQDTDSDWMDDLPGMSYHDYKSFVTNAPSHIEYKVQNDNLIEPEINQVEPEVDFNYQADSPSGEIKVSHNKADLMYDENSYDDTYSDDYYYE